MEWGGYMREILSMLASFVSNHQRDWDQAIPLVMMAYRSSVHESTGVTPCKMMFGQDVHLPVDLLNGKPELTNVTLTSDIISFEQQIKEVHAFAREKLKVSMTQ